MQHGCAFMGSVSDAMQTPTGQAVVGKIPLFSPLRCFSGSLGCVCSHRTGLDPSGEGTMRSLATGGTCHAVLSAQSKPEIQVSAHSPFDSPADGCREGPF